jgi:hypothetical protein
VTGKEHPFRGRPINAYKWLKRGAVDPDGGFEWAAGSARTTPLTGPRIAVHGCLPAGLPYEVNDELWEVVLEDVIGCQPFLHQKTEGEFQHFEYEEQSIFALSGHLVRQIHTWTPTVAREFARECALETRWRALKALHDATQVLEDALATEQALQEREPAGPPDALSPPLAEQEVRKERDVIVLAHAGRLLSIWDCAREGQGSPAQRACVYASAAAASRAAAAITYAAAFDSGGLKAPAEAAGSAYADERRRQARWLRERLGLHKPDAGALVRDVA